MPTGLHYGLNPSCALQNVGSRRYWRLANRRQPDGALGNTRFTGGIAEISAVTASVPTDTDPKRAFESAGGLPSHRTRALEVWWDGPRQTLDMILVSGSDDISEYKQNFLAMYPNSTFEESHVTAPQWYDPAMRCQAFDVGYRHGHISAVFDAQSGRDTMTRICGAVQLASHAWIQIVFKRHGFVGHLQDLASRMQRLHRSITEDRYYAASDLLSSDGRDHPERGKDFVTHYAMLESHIAQKMQGDHVMLSVRGILDSERDIRLDFGSIRSVPMRSMSFEHLVMNTYGRDFLSGGRIRVSGKKTAGRTAIFERRLLPEPDEISGPVSRYASKSWLGRYHLRGSPPFILMAAQETGLLLRLPDPATPNLPISRRQIIPQQQQPAKTGFCLGYPARARSSRYGPAGMFFGRLVQAAEEQGIVLSTQDLLTHIYIVGGTKSGKTTMLRCIAKHMEMANLNDVLPNAFIMIDPKGTDSYDFLRQCEPATYERGGITFLDPIDTKFSINVLELPPHDPARRESTVSQYVGYIMQMIEYWYQGSENFVRLKRILDTLLQYIYLNNDKPTFLDMYEIIVAMQKNGREMLVKMFKELGRPESALQQAVESVAGMEKLAYEPALNRLEKFATDPVLRHMFCVRESTVKFERLISAGAYTIIRLSPLNIPQHIITLAKQTLIVKLWFAIQERAERVKLEEDRTQVLLALDEFQDVARLPAIEAMLTQARSYGLGLLLAHQATTQLDDGLFEIIVGNAGTQLVGRVSGRDGGRFGDAWDPAYAREIKSQLATQEYHHWTARLVPEGGGPQPLPVQFWPVYTDKDVQTDGFLKEFVASQRQMFGSGKVGTSMMRQASRQENAWLNNIPYEPPPGDEWEIMCIMAEAGTALLLKDVVERFGSGTTPSDEIAKILRRMARGKVLKKGARGAGYSMPYAVRCKYFGFDPGEIGTSEDIPRVMAAATEHYIGSRHFLCVATQTVKRGRMRTDLAAYDYETGTPISVEIESAAEVERHPEHVRLNMSKWKDLGFARCDVWSTSSKITSIRDSLPEEERRNVQTFIVPRPGEDAGKDAPHMAK